MEPNLDRFGAIKCYAQGHDDDTPGFYKRLLNNYLPGYNVVTSPWTHQGVSVVTVKLPAIARYVGAIYQVRANRHVMQ